MVTSMVQSQFRIFHRVRTEPGAFGAVSPGAKPGRRNDLGVLKCDTSRPMTDPYVNGKKNANKTGVFVDGQC